MTEQARASIDHLNSLTHFLSSPLPASLFAHHPNNLPSSSFVPPSEWHSWWSWISPDTATPNETHSDPWLLILQHCYEGSSNAHSSSSIPLTIRTFVDHARSLAISRDVTTENASESMESSTAHPRSLPGMSPKKAHEVEQMSAYVRSLRLADVKHVVDVGAGQAYLSRALRDRLGLHVLALDWSQVQSQGATRKDTSKAHRKSNQRCCATDEVTALADSASERSRNDSGPHGSLTYVTIQIDKDSLLSSVNRWLQGGGTDVTPSLTQSTPILLVALHACGSLTVDILRAFFSAANRSESDTSASWHPRGAIVVGCCYNMLHPQDFPLSQALRSSGSAPILTSSHLQLAAQVPSQWLQTPESLKEARLALRKIVWRAVLEEELSKHRNARSSSDQGTDRSPRLGRLNDSAYADWDTFCGVVRRKMELPTHVQIPQPDPLVEKRIEVLHTLRCIMGPVVESLILLDRLAWIREELAGLPYQAELVNLFDQARGSGRNVAIVIQPT